MQQLPKSRGPLSAYLLAQLSGPAKPLVAAPGSQADWEDLHLALYLCYELHYLGLEGIDVHWEWEPSLLELRRGLEESFTQHLMSTVPFEEVSPSSVEDRLSAISRRTSDFSICDYLADRGTLDEYREFVVHRSLYHLKEADPHSWAIPRLYGKPKAALIEIQADEYGGGREPWMHSNLFRKLMNALGLDSRYGQYLDLVPAQTLATINLMSMFGLHRRWRGALVGHLALFEMTSSRPNRLYGDGLRRLGFGEEATHFYDEHVEADSLHEVIAAHDLAAELAQQQPPLAAEIVFGAECLLALDDQVGKHLLSSWAAGSSSLLA